jgi:hypothetical protein
MKWAKSQQEVKDILKHSFNRPNLGFVPHKHFSKKGPHKGTYHSKDKKVRNCFKIYDDKKLKAAVKPFKLWTHFKMPMQPGDRAAKLRYELFYGGWLQYFDKVTRNGSTEHIIWFDWPKNKGDEVKVMISVDKHWELTKPPGAGDPPPPTHPPPY